MPSKSPKPRETNFAFYSKTTQTKSECARRRVFRHQRLIAHSREKRVFRVAAHSVALIKVAINEAELENRMRSAAFQKFLERSGKRLKAKETANSTAFQNGKTNHKNSFVCFSIKHQYYTIQEIAQVSNRLND